MIDFSSGLLTSTSEVKGNENNLIQNSPISLLLFSFLYNTQVFKFAYCRINSCFVFFNQSKPFGVIPEKRSSYYPELQQISL